MRGGFGLYHSNPNNDTQRTSGFSTSTSLVSSTDGNRTPIGVNLNNPYPNGIQYPTGSSLGAATFVGQNPSLVRLRLPDSFGVVVLVGLPVSAHAEFDA